MTRHPDLHAVEAHCTTCGTTFDLRSTADSISVDVCSSCHPAYTGQERTTTAGSRIERFNRRRAAATA